LVLVVLAMAAMGAAPAGQQPNVIVILTDDQGYGDVSAHGNPTLKTPNLDRLHRQSIRLTDFHVSPMCTPTRGQLMTGRDALDNGAMNVSSGRTMTRVGMPTMAEVFRRGGYRTGIFGKWHLGDVYPHRPMDRGFEKSVWFPSSHIPSAPDYWNNDYFDPHLRVNSAAPTRFKGYCTDVFFDEAMSWMREAAGDRAPFFCYVPTNAPHAPLWVENRYRDPYKHLDPKLASFFAMIGNIDENVGRLLAFLDKSGLAENTVVIFMTDNGGTVGVPHFNAGMKGTKVTLWDGGHRVPCFIRVPKSMGFGTPRDVGGLTQVQDLMPTLAEACGLDRPGELDGLSLVPLLRNGRELPERMLVVQFSRMNQPRPEKGDAAVLWRRWRLMNKGTELYDLSTDPHQDRNVAGEHPDVVKKMRDRYERWWAEVEPRVNEVTPLTVGDVHEGETMLSAADWVDVFLDQQAQVRAAPEKRNGAWSLNVARTGTYRFELRRYPREADLALSAAAPEQKFVDGTMRSARAVPIAKAKIRVGEKESSADAEAGAKAVTFSVPLESGPTTLQSHFYDAAGNELIGAYYVYVRRM
jgi:arylsulfatase